MTNYDVIIIGAGPAGYVAAIRCAQLGMKVACVDNLLNDKGKSTLGGTCLNVGCIPSKVLLESSHHYDFMRKKAAEHGILCDNLRIDIAAMQARKNKVVKILTQGIASLFKKHKINRLEGNAKILPNKCVEITEQNGNVQNIQANHIIIATGSKPAEIPVAPFDGQFIVDSTGALNFDTVPKRLGIIGAGAIGLELGSVWRRLGSEVTILEALPDFLPIVDTKIAEIALREFKRQGLNPQLATKIISIIVKNQEVIINYSNKKGEQQVVVDKLIVAAGRKPNIENLLDSAVGIELNERGFIQVDKNCQTSIEGMYAIGDVIGGAMLAHKASEEGVMVAERLAGLKSTMNYHIIPAIIYTSPEIAWVGQTEQMLKNQGVAYKIGEFPFLANGRARAQGETAGMVKILSESETHRLLGVHLIGYSVSELLAESVLAMKMGATSGDLAETIHAHPTLSESVHEAALSVDEKAIHI